jgi:hypothetical protein
MKTLKGRAARPSPAEVLQVAAETAPRQPPAAASLEDKATTLNLRMRASTISALALAARERGQTQKQVIAHALAKAGVAVAPDDLEDRTPRRRM